MRRPNRSNAGPWTVVCPSLALLLLAGCGGDAASGTPLEPVAAEHAVSSKVDLQLDQCANADAAPCSWQRGDLNVRNAAYAEGDVVPFRLSMSGLDVGQTYVVTLGWDFTVEGHQAYDFLATVDATESVDVCGMSGRSLPAACEGPLGFLTTIFVPSDPFTSADTDGSLPVSGAMPDGHFKLYGGTLTSISPYSHAGDTDGASTATISLTFTADRASTLLLWGGHVASGSYWIEGGAPDGAGAIVEGPWRMRAMGFTSRGSAAVRGNVSGAMQPSALQ